MKQVIGLLCWLMPLISHTQIKFSTADNWDSVLAQAKKEQKLIFLDAVASWCGPCKRMDAEVYNNKKIEDYVNSNFIPVKVQFDQSEKDPQVVKNWYADAKILMAKYNITAFPTYLFINSEGTVVEKGSGFQPEAEFLLLLKKANDSNANYAAAVAKYHAGEIRGHQLMSLAIRAKKIPDTAFANRLAKIYYATVLKKEDPSNVLNPELRDFIVDFQHLFSLDDRLIKYFYSHQAEVNAKLDYNNFAEKVIDYLVNRDLILPVIEPEGKHQSKVPDWKALTKMVKKAFDSKTAERLIINNQIEWYKLEKDWPNFVKYTIAQLEAKKLDTVGIMARSNINNISFNVVFTYSNDPAILKKAIGYMELILPHNPDMHTWIDTYANLLYKVGRKEEAITLEEKALKLAKESEIEFLIREYELTLHKMKNNKPTWSTTNTVDAQKKLTLTDTSYKNWSYIQPGYTGMNNEGSFFYYVTGKKPINQYQFGEYKLVLSATNNSWQCQFTSSSDFSGMNFTPDSRYFFLMKTDTLTQVDLKTKKIVNTVNCKNYSLIRQMEKSWVVCHLANPGNELIIQNPDNRPLHTFSTVSGYDINPNASVVVLRRKTDADSEKLFWLDLITMKPKEIYSGQPANRIIFDRSGKHMAFYALNEGKTTVWSYNSESQQYAKQIADDNSKGIADGHIIGTDIWRFSSNGEDIFFNQKLKGGGKRHLKSDPVIWNFQDAYLVSYYKPGNYENERNFSALNIHSGKIKQLLSGMQLPEIKQGVSNDVIIVKSSFGDELPWNADISYYLLFMKTGELRPVIEHAKSPLAKMTLSPDSRFLIYYDTEQENYFSYDLKSKQTVRLEKLPGGATGIDEFRRNLFEHDQPLGISCWIKETDCAIIQGKYDLWKVDVTGKNRPVNLTNSDGERRTVFALLDKYKNGFVNGNESMYIMGFDLSDKTNGLYKLSLNKRKIDLLCKTRFPVLDPYNNTIVFKPGKMGVLIAYETASSAVNYNFTRDFKKFVKLSDVHPEKEYNWMTAELVKYKDSVGDMCEGKLFKPEDFDPTKKYPVIFYYYCDHSNQLDNFILPGPSSIGFNIPLLLSRGYLVFWPNIYSEKRQPGESALRSVIAGVDYLTQFAWADTSKMAIIGHSWGGYVTNFVVSHTNRFKAAISLAGLSNLLELYNDVLPGLGNSLQPGLKNGYFWMVDGLESDVLNYVKNSPIVYARDINTPVLLMHNQLDANAPVNHSIQLFVQLRSLNKPVWLLQYEGEKHVVANLKNQYDLQNKVISFFDHYLMGKPMPDWLGNPISQDALSIPAS